MELLAEIGTEGISLWRPFGIFVVSMAPRDDSKLSTGGSESEREFNSQGQSGDEPVWPLTELDVGITPQGGSAGVVPLAVKRVSGIHAS